jgi:hypothetical protein
MNGDALDEYYEFVKWGGGADRSILVYSENLITTQNSTNKSLSYLNTKT